jgi:hypothetical protein
VTTRTGASLGGGRDQSGFTVIRLPVNSDDWLAGLVDGSSPNFLGIVLSHIHGDHNGLTGLVHANVPVFMGVQAQALLRTSQPFLRQTAVPPTVRNYANETRFSLGPFRITPFLTDHSG